MRYAISYLLLNVICRLLPHPKIRARYLQLLGARIGKDVRVDDVRFVQIQYPITNLACADGAFIGANVTIDLSARISIGMKSVIGPGCTIMTHEDFGHFNGNCVAGLYPLKMLAVNIGDHVAIGSDTTILGGTVVEGFSVIGAKSLVSGTLCADGLYVGIPAKLVRRLEARRTE